MQEKYHRSADRRVLVSKTENLCQSFKSVKFRQSEFLQDTRFPFYVNIERHFCHNLAVDRSRHDCDGLKLIPHLADCEKHQLTEIGEPFAWKIVGGREEGADKSRARG